MNDMLNYEICEVNFFFVDKLYYKVNIENLIIRIWMSYNRGYFW